MKGNRKLYNAIQCDFGRLRCIEKVYLYGVGFYGMLREIT